MQGRKLRQEAAQNKTTLASLSLGSTPTNSAPTSPGAVPKGFANSRADVGTVLEVYSTRYNNWQRGQVMAYDGIRKMHMVRNHNCASALCRSLALSLCLCVGAQVAYEDGTRKWHMMKDKKLRIITSSGDAGLSLSTQPASKSTTGVRSERKRYGRCRVAGQGRAGKLTQCALVPGNGVEGQSWIPPFTPAQTR